jgi:hypothetical protein
VGPEAVWTFGEKIRKTRSIFRALNPVSEDVVSTGNYVQLKHSYLLVHRKCQPYFHYSCGIDCSANPTDLLDF